jgi:glyoxylase-like metal-dependent hydrolase (beta-lactamase superfamily II)
MIKISSVEGNQQWLDGGSMFGNAPRSVWSQWTKIDSSDRIPLACRCLLVETADQKILCETGIGAFFEPKLADRFGVQNSDKHMLLENLAQLGHKPESINYVILSHLHFDHAGGLLPTYKDLQKDPIKLVFPNAKFLVGEKAWERAINPHPRDKASFIPDINKSLKDSGRLLILENNEVPKDLKNILKLYESNGHTPGQMHSIFKSNNKRIVFAADLIPGVPWVHLPITMGYDRFPELLIEEKESLYKKYENTEFSIFFTHDPNYSMGRLQRDEKGKYQVIDLEKSLKNKDF